VRRAAVIPWLVAACGAAAYLLLDPPSADLAAQEYRAQLVRDAGLTLWNNGWFAGHHTLGYSVLFPPLGAAIGVRAAGALAAVAATGLFALLARGHWGERAGNLAALWFATGAGATLASGRLTFMLGVAVGLGALLALRCERHRSAAVLAALTTLASPVAGLFLALAALAWGLDRGGGGRAEIVVAPALTVGVVALLLFPQGGTEPFVASAFWPALAGAALVAALLPARERALRIGAGLFALACAAAFVVDTPLGGNVTRLGALAAGPVVLGAALAARRSPALLAAVALPLAYWQLYPAVRDVVRASGDPSVDAAYHVPLVRYLEGRPGAFRVEIPLTENHWEALHVARSIPLARGWERQLDRRYGALFYDGRLDARRYRAWLDQHAVAYVALPDVPLDYAARDEARLIERGLAFLRPVWHGEHWRVLAVTRPALLAERPARRITLHADGFTLRARRAGVALVRVRHTRWWRVTSGRACVEAARDGMTRVRVRAPGTVRVQARLTGSSCR
jgi:hypothetical protein